jgi:hypothetical protein
MNNCQQPTKFSPPSHLEHKGLHKEDDCDPAVEGDLTQFVRIGFQFDLLWATQLVNCVRHEIAISPIRVVVQAVGPAVLVDMIL